jgi:hypothetical protein
MMWLLVVLFLSARCDASVEIPKETEGFGAIAARVELAAAVNQQLSPGFIDQVVPFKSYLYEVYQTNLDDLYSELQELEFQTYRQRLDLNYFLTVNHLSTHCRADAAVCAVPQKVEEWDFEKLLGQVGVRVVKSAPRLEGPARAGQAVLSQEGGLPDPLPGVDAPSHLKVPRDRQVYIRAFDPSQTILEFVRTEMVSFEPMQGKVRGWQEAVQTLDLNSGNGDRRGEIYWPTLSWVDPTQEFFDPIPLVSSNTVHILESKFRKKLGGGIVFGQVSADWVIKFGDAGATDAPQHPVFLNERFEPMLSEVSSVARYFIYTDVKPGSGLIQVISTQFPWSGSLRFPVLEGKATFLDLSRPSVKTIVGKVVDKEADSGEVSAEWSTIRVAGQSSPIARADDQGAFRLHNVLAFSNYPIFLDAERSGKTTLRYRVLPHKPHSVVLYRMREREIDSWRAQLNLFQQEQATGHFGLNRENPMVVGYLRNPIGRNLDADLVPLFRLLPSSGQWAPTPHVRAPNGLLEKDVYLGVHDSRVVTASLPHSGFLMGLQEEGGQVVYSEWGYGSPHVVNVIGPD